MDYGHYYSDLKEKGWSKEDIYKTIKIIDKAKEKKPKKVRILDQLVYWFVLMISIFGNLVISIALVPFLLVLKSIALYSIIAILAFVFGVLFDFLIKEVESLEAKHYIVASIFIPALALINVFYLTGFANYVSAAMNLQNQHSPLIVSVVYVFFFVLPYLISKLKKK